MNFTDYKKQFDRTKTQQIKEMPIAARFGADFRFVEDEDSLTKCTTAEIGGVVRRRAPRLCGAPAMPKLPATIASYANLKKRLRIASAQLTRLSLSFSA